MKLKKILFILLVIGIIFLTGCSGSSSDDDNQQYWGSGGCGVGAPDIDYNDNLGVVEKADNIDNLGM